ncbi:TonB-dependent receptor domain-containing protein [Steroidobacter flavus]|uniref:TonB-dependent receptor domain-containing protein n=1 Tax=Steroidobacter flavus TaxID=1842136 RepID=A0ABV8SZ96_9GAMM
MRTSVAVGVVFLSLTGLSLSDSVRAAIRKPTSIPAQDLGHALTVLAKERGLQLVYVADEVDSIHTAGASGNLTSEEALTQLLSGTGFTHRVYDDNAVGIVPIASESVSSAPASLQDSNVDQLEEVIVTATKRSERAIDIPQSISVIGKDFLQSLHVTGLTDVASQVPGLVVTNYGSPGRTSITLRGLASQGAGALVSTVVDDAAVGSSAGWAGQDSLQLDLLPDDIQRIEVLRGPQGTLYGANSMGGVVRYITVDPDVNANDLRLGAEGFSYAGASKAGYAGHIALNQSLVPGSLAVRASVYDRRTPGNFDNPVRGTRDENPYSKRGGRLALLWQPADTLKVKLQGFYSEIDSDNRNFSRAALTGTTSPYGVGAPLEGWLTFGHRLPEPFKNEVVYTAATVNWDAGFADVTSATSYSRTLSQVDSDSTVSYLALLNVFDPAIGANGAALGGATFVAKKISEELRLSSKEGAPLDWLAGLYVTHEKAQNNQFVSALDSSLQPVAGLSPFATIHLPTQYDDVAVFGNVTYHFTPSLDVTVGVRGSRVRQDFRLAKGGPLFGGIETVELADSSENVFTYAVSPRYRMGADAIIYARAATGYRPGSPQATYPQYPEIPSQTDSDRTANYEIGFKGDFLERQLTLDAAAYQIDWTRIQVPSATHDGALTYQVNAATAVSRGVEASLGYAPNRQVRLGLSASLSKAHFTQGDPNGNFTDGAALPLAPKWTGSAFANVTMNPIGQWLPSFSTNVRYVGSTFNFASSMASAVKFPDYVIADAAAEIDNGQTRISLYVRNLGNRYVYTGGGATVDGLTGAIYVLGTTLAQRTIGLSVDWRL